METEHFLAWLNVADLEATGDDGLRDLMEQVLEAAPEEPGGLLDSLLDELEAQLDAERLDHDAILAWPDTFSALLSPALEPLEQLEEELDSRAEALDESALESPRLRLFRECLERLRSSADREQTLAAWSELERLEAGMQEAHAEYLSEPFTPEAVSAESVAGHRLLQDGFECWLEAFDLAKVGEADEALALAAEGNRLFKTVADWSDEVSES